VEYITSLDELRAIAGEPGRAARTKVLRELDEHARDYITRSRFCVLATCGGDGTCDVSPRGEPGAIALVLDPTTLVLPDRPGNRRLDSFSNIIENPHVGLLFLMPPMTETLRVNGRARLVRNAPYFADLAVDGRQPRFAVEVNVEEVYLHCAKALLRSALWQPETWPERQELPSAAQIWRDHARIKASVDEIDAALQDDYRTGLY
jgi:uncharacterized protein